jgi:hypothetical protein
MSKRISFADTISLGAKHFTDRANNASSEAEKQSLQRCAEASARLGAKVRELQQKHTGMPLFQVVNGLPEHQMLVRERKLRFALIDGGNVHV